MMEHIDERLVESQDGSNPYCSAQEHLEKLLFEGLESGEPIDVTDDYARRKRAELVSKLEGSTKLGH